MADTKVYKTIFQIRRDTAENWNKSTLILREGEPACAYDTGVFKLGDGVHTWNELLPTADPRILNMLQEQVLGVGSESGNGQTLLERIEAVENVVGSGNGDGSEQNLLGRVESIEKLIGGTEDGTAAIDTVVELITYVEEHGSTTEMIVSKLETIENGAQVNKIEGITLNGEKVEVIDKTANIPVAKLGSGGVVKSAIGANRVNVSNDGTMSVNKVSATSIVAPIGTVIIFDGGGAFEEEEKYETIIGNIGYGSLIEAVAAADNGDIVSLQSDVDLGTEDTNHLTVNSENVIIDLGECTLSANGSNGAIKVEGGMTTLKGSGTIKAGLGSDAYSMAVWADNGTVVINDGVYTNATDGSERGTDLIYASGTATIEINGGTFIAAKPEWTLNCKDADYKTGAANIIVKGGMFYNFDPANNNTEGAGTCYVPKGYQSVKDGDYYIVSVL